MSKGNYLIKDLTNKRFGHLTALESTDERQNKRVVWLCRCDCGNLVKVNSVRLQSGMHRSCGCNLPDDEVNLNPKNKWYRPVKDVMVKREDLTGRQFGKLTVLEFDSNNTSTNTKWICKCECGNIRSVTASRLKSGEIISCGCTKRKRKTKEYKRFDNLVVLKTMPEKYYGGLIVWKCRCNCGNEFLALMNTVINGSIKSCGCHIK